MTKNSRRSSLKEFIEEQKKLPMPKTKKKKALAARKDHSPGTGEE